MAALLFNLVDYVKKEFFDGYTDMISLMYPIDTGEISFEEIAEEEEKMYQDFIQDQKVSSKLEDEFSIIQDEFIWKASWIFSHYTTFIKDAKDIIYPTSSEEFYFDFISRFYTQDTKLVYGKYFVIKLIYLHYSKMKRTLENDNEIKIEYCNRILDLIHKFKNKVGRKF